MEDAETLEQPALVRIEQLVALGDRRAQRPLSGWCIARPRQREALLQLLEELGGSQQPEPWCGELDCEWDPVYRSYLEQSDIYLCPAGGRAFGRHRDLPFPRGRAGSSGRAGTLSVDETKTRSRRSGVRI